MAVLTTAATYRQMATADATAYRLLLGNGWVQDGHVVTSGDVTIDALADTITWLDLAPDDEPREQRTLRIPTGTSHGATVTLAEALRHQLVHADGFEVI